MKKRIISFSLLLLMVLGITSCKGKQEEKQYLKKVDNIIQAIDELPDVVTLDDDIKVREISYSYESLPNEYKEKVTNYQKLQDAILKIDNLKKEQEYQTAANSVIRKINILPSLEDIRIEDKELVIAAREKYEELEEEAKAFVTNYDKLLDLEARIVELENEEEAIKKVIDLINNLPSSHDLTIHDKTLVEQAREEYEALSLEQKKEITNLALLEEAEAQMAIIEKDEQDKALAAEIVEMIYAIPSIENLTIDDKTMLQNIRYQYGTLSDNAKALVTNLEILEKAEEQMEILKYIEGLKTDAKHVDELIASLPSLEEVTLEDKARISNARNWYNRLSDDAKVYVTNLEKLKGLEQKIVELEQIELYKEKAEVVINLISALPSVDEITLDDQDVIVNARNKYNALSATVKNYVTNLDVLEAAEAKLQDLIKNKEYEVFFYLDGGTLEGTTLVSDQLYKGVYKGMNTLGTPKKDGYLFIGFFTNANCTGEIISTVSDTITLYAGWMIDNSNLPTSEILNCVSDQANSYTKDSLVLENDEATFTWSTSNPNLYHIEDGMGTISKYMDGHAVQVGGVIVDSGKFDWNNGNFPELTEPDESYHGLIYTETYGNKAYIIKARMQLMRDFGVYPAARFLESQEQVESVTYPGLESDANHALAQKYLKGASGVISFEMKGGREAAMKFMNALKLASNEVHVADIRTCVLHPASETHRQLTDQQLKDAGISGGMIRFSVGLENIDDILDDLKQAFAAIA